MSTQPFTVAIDGPAAAGKGTIGRAIAERFGLAHLDTGLLYRAVGARVLTGADPVEAARPLNAGALEDEALRTAAVAQEASKVAVIPEVRAALLDFQRAFDCAGGEIAGFVADAGGDNGEAEIQPAQILLADFDPDFLVANTGKGDAVNAVIEEAIADLFGIAFDGGFREGAGDGDLGDIFIIGGALDDRLFRILRQGGDAGDGLLDI